MTINELKSTLRGEKTIGDTIKSVGGMVVGFGADIVATMALTALTAGGAKSSKGLKKVAIGAGIFMLSMKIGEEVEEYFYKTCDGLKDAFSKAKKEVEEAKKEAETEDENEE